MSPEGIMGLLNKDISARNQDLQEMSYDLLRDKDGLNLYEYQIRAIKARLKKDDYLTGGVISCLLWRQVQARPARFWA